MTSLNLNPLLKDLNTVTLGGGEGSPCQSGRQRTNIQYTGRGTHLNLTFKLV